MELGNCTREFHRPEVEGGEPTQRKTGRDGIEKGIQLDFAGTRERNGGKGSQDWKRWEGARDLVRHLRLLEDPGGVV